MATALAPEKPPLGQKMPWAGSRLENRPLSRRMHREKCRSLVRPASGAPVFANGAVTAAMAYAFNSLSESAQQNDDLVLSADEESLVVRASGNLPDPSQGGHEAWLSIDESGVVSGVHTEGCTPNYCLVDPSGARVIIHTHPAVEGNQATQLAREWPGPGDHRLIAERGVINVIRTPSGAIRAIERVDGDIRLRTIHGGASRLNSHVERTWQPGMNDRQILRQAERFRR